jgi:hypothetical protein
MSKSEFKPKAKPIRFNLDTIRTPLDIHKDVFVNDSDNTFSIRAKKYENYFPQISSETKLIATTQIIWPVDSNNKYTIIHLIDKMNEESPIYIRSNYSDTCVFVFNNLVDNHDILQCMSLRFHDTHANSDRIDFSKLIIIGDDYCTNIHQIEDFFKKTHFNKQLGLHKENLANLFEITCYSNNILNFLPINTIKTLREVSKQFKNIIYNLPYSCDLEYYDLPDDPLAYYMNQMIRSRNNRYMLQKIPDFRWLIKSMPNTVCASIHAAESMFNILRTETSRMSSLYFGIPAHILPSSEISRLHNLKTLKVFGNVDISFISNLTKLENLCLERQNDNVYNRIVVHHSTVTDNTIRNLVNLRHLNVPYCSNLTDASVGLLVNLRHLNVSNCRNFTDASIGRLVNLQYLNISHSRQISDTSISQLVNLRYLDISHCVANISDESISNLIQLETLIMADCNEHLISDDCLMTLQHLRKLRIVICEHF